MEKEKPGLHQKKDEKSKFSLAVIIEKHARSQLHLKCVKKDMFNGAHVSIGWALCAYPANMHNIFAQNAINLELAAHFILMCHKLFK